MSELYLVRHAQASFGKENYDRLSDLGVKQAKILGDYFLHLGLTFNSAYSGSMKRQTDTANTVMSRTLKDCTKLELRIAPEFNEYDSTSIIKSHLPYMTREDPSISEALTRMYTDRRSFQRVFEGAMLRWISGSYQLPRLETWGEFALRVRAGVSKVMEENGRKKRIVIFSSGGPLSAVMQMALKLSDEEAMLLAWQIRNASVSTFKYNDSRVSLSSFNSVAHLECHKEPDLISYR
jgi:broad specificity phosphatase PhoE